MVTLDDRVADAIPTAPDGDPRADDQLTEAIEEEALDAVEQDEEGRWLT